MRREVDDANRTRLQRLAGDSMVYDAYDVAGIDSNGKRITEQKKFALLEKLVAPKSITLKACG
jgi:ATP-dependent DNA helicase PIF1